jgi:choline dehydrogenase-like flavoprotein
LERSKSAITANGGGGTVPDADVIIVGSGMGGATVAAALAPSGRRIVIVERGQHLRDTPKPGMPRRSSHVGISAR